MEYILSESELRETVAFEMVNRVCFKKTGNKYRIFLSYLFKDGEKAVNILIGGV